MLKNYLKIALRNLRRHKAYSFINVAGLSLGLACFTLIMLFVLDERSYDRFHDKADDIYRVTLSIEASEGATTNAQTAPVWSTLLRDGYPEIVEAVRFKPPRQTWMVSYEDKRFTEKGWAFADAEVFDVFDFELVQGVPATALSLPWQVVISESAAAKYFGGRDPMGQTMTIDNQYDFVVTGIYRDMPANAHFHFDFMASFISMEDPTKLYLLNVPQAPFPFAYTYVVLAEDADPAALAAKFPAFIEQNVPEQFRRGNAIRIGLQPLTQIHLHSSLENEIEPNGDASVVYIFFAIALFVLLIACINFMNLATARSAKRAKEVGLRKVVGAHRGHVMQQFLGESMLLAVLALVVGLLMVLALLPSFNTLTGKAITVGTLFAPGFLAALVGIALVAGLVAGSYPAFYLSAFRPAAVLKGHARTGSGSQAVLRKGLIVFQFGISLVLIISTMVVYRQMDYVQGKQLGFDKEHVVVVQLTDPTPSNRFPAFREAILQHPKVLSVTSAQSVPGGLMQQAQMRPIGSSDDQFWQMQLYVRDYDFVETMGMTMVAGRDYTRDQPSDTLATVLINETAARSMGWADPAAAVNQELVFRGNNPQPLRIRGVVKDFHSQSVHEQIAPLVMVFNSFRFFGLVRVAPGNLAGTIETMQQTWAQMLPGYSFNYSFLDDDFSQLYQREAVLSTLLGAFAFLTVVIACLGLFGLASFTAEQRTKEIGVRKVMGASVGGIVLLLAREVTWLVLLSFTVAIPVAYFMMAEWLAGFAYHIDMPLLVFAVAGVLALVIAWTTVAYQTLRAALVNPVVSLRYQ